MRPCEPNGGLYKRCSLAGVTVAAGEPATSGRANADYELPGIVSRALLSAVPHDALGNSPGWHQATDWEHQAGSSFSALSSSGPRRAWVRSAPLRSAPVSVAPRRSAYRRSARTSVVLASSAPRRSVARGNAVPPASAGTVTAEGSDGFTAEVLVSSGSEGVRRRSPSLTRYRQSNNNAYPDGSVGSGRDLSGDHTHPLANHRYREQWQDRPEPRGADGRQNPLGCAHSVHLLPIREADRTRQALHRKVLHARTLLGIDLPSLPA